MVLITNIPEQLPISYGATNATTAIGTGTYDGQQYLQVGSVTQNYRRSLWVWSTGLSAWQCVPLSPIQSTGSPLGSVTPDAIGQYYFATDTNNLYIATGLTSSDWTLTN